MDVDDLERQHTLMSAVIRYDELRTRDSLADPDDPAGPRPLTREEALELLALAEVIARRAPPGRQRAGRAARSPRAARAAARGGPRAPRARGGHRPARRPGAAADGAHRPLDRGVLGADRTRPR